MARGVRGGLFESAARGVPRQVIEVARKFAKILGVVSPLVVIRDSQTSRWTGRHTIKSNKPVLIEIQKRVLGHERTLERVVAHEMAHHADLVKQLRSYVSSRSVLDTIINEGNFELLSPGALQRLERGHGKSWQEEADRVNRAMGDREFVTVFSDSTHVTAPTTSKEYHLMVAPLGDGRFGIAVAVGISERVRIVLAHLEGAKLFVTNDARWRRRGIPNIGSGRVAIPAEQAELAKIYSKGRQALK